MDCPTALWLSRTDVSCDKRSCCCHPGRADTLHILLTAGFPLSVPPFGWHHSCPKVNPKWEDLSGFVCCRPWFDAITLQMERLAQSVRAESGWWTTLASGLAWWHPSTFWTNRKLKLIRGLKTVFTSECRPPKTTSYSDSTTHPHVCVTEAKWLNLTHIFLSYSPCSQMFLIHFSQAQLHV